MQVADEQLKDFILDSGLLSRGDFTKAEKEAKDKDIKLEDALLAQGEVSEDDIRRVKAYVLGIPFVNLQDHIIDFDVLSMIPEPVARKNNIIAFKKTDKELEVAMLDTDDLRAIEFIKKKVGLKILPRLTDTDSVKSSLMQYQKTLKDEFGDIIKKESESIKEVDDEDLEKVAEDLPVIRIVNALLKHAIIQDASDIHIEPMEQQILVRYRIDGILHDAMKLPKVAGPSIVARIKVLSSLKLDEKRLPQDGRFKLEVDGEKVSFRVSILPTYFGEKVVMRLLREGGGGFTLEGLGFHGEGMQHIHDATKKTTGMILTTGPTGSGKTTTLYTVLDLVNTPNINISTIEDPIEYQVPRINQTQVRPDIGFTFANGLRALVRQDPDVIMVGEIRDTETASLAVNAALTGHLVLSTLHTNSAAGAVPRLLEMGVEPFLLVSTINVIIGQRLIRVLCESKEEYKLTKKELDSLAENANLDLVLETLKDEKIIKDSVTSLENVIFFKPKPTKTCEDGYKGRLGIHEILSITSSVKEMIMMNKTADEISEQARKDGMLTMLEDGIIKAAQGVTTLEEVLRVTSE